MNFQCFNFQTDKNGNKGFSTLEILLAMFILVMAMSAVILTSFGNQSMAIDSQTNSEALNMAQGMLESAQAQARLDFNLVNPQNATTTSDGFSASLDVNQKDFFTKLVTANVQYPEDGSRKGITKLSTIVTNYNNAVGGNTCYSTLLNSFNKPDADAWKTPQIVKTVANSDIAAQTLFTSDNFPITDLDAYKDRLYITIGDTATSTVPTFFEYDISDDGTGKPKMAPITNIDNDTNVKTGLNAVVVAEDPASSAPADKKPIYAYVASATGKHFQVIKVADNGSDLVPPQVVDISSMGTAGTNNQQGNAIAYKNGYVYLGLTSDGSHSNFFIIDVHNPLNPALVAGGTYVVPNNDINAVYVRNQYAYLATPSSNDLVVLDVSNPAGPQLAGSYQAGAGGHGKSIYFLGDELYLGRTVSSDPEFYILNDSDPKKIGTNNPSPVNKEIGISVDGVITRIGPDAAGNNHTLAFLLTKTDFEVWDTAGTMSAWASANLILPAKGSKKFEPVFDCEKNTFYVAATDDSDNCSSCSGNGKGNIYVINP